jgi:hypothetical protein
MARIKGKSSAERPLTTKQQKFVDAYCGNATDAARLAGYAVPRDAGAANLKNPVIAQAIKARQDEEARPVIATRQTRQKFWSETMQNKKIDYKHRLKASELLGRSEADFTDNLKHELPAELVVRWADAPEGGGNGQD